MTTQPKVNESITTIIRTLARIQTKTKAMTDVQWDKGRRPSTVEDAGTRQRGGKADPTGETATDLPRLGVRDALSATHRDLDRIAKDLIILEGRLGLVMAKWEAEG